jgi:hypothetical protein
VPIVPGYGQPRVDLQPQPRAYKQNTSTPETYGAGVGASLERIGTTLFDQLYQKQRQKADQVALLDADTQLGSWATTALLDPQHGALTVHGKDALGLPEQVLPNFDEVAGKISQGLASDDQRQAFAAQTARRRAALEERLSAHVADEMQNYDATATDAGVKLAATSAIANAGNPHRVNDDLSRGLAIIADHGTRMGMSADAVALQAQAFTTAVHSGVIDRLLAQGNDQVAQVWYDETKNQISGDAQAHIEAALAEGTLRAQAQKQADAILAKGGTLTEQRDQAKAITDPKLRDEVTQRLEHEAVVNEAAARDQERAVLTDAYNRVDQTHSVASIPPSVWSTLDGGARASLRSYAEQLARGVPVTTDDPTYYRLMMLAAKDPDSFVTENLLRYKSKLGESDFKQLTEMQVSITRGDRKSADAQLDDFRTETQVVDEALTLHGIDTTGKVGKTNEVAVARLRRMVGDQVAALQRNTAHKATNADVQGIVDNILTRQVDVPGGWFGLFGPGHKRVIDLTIDDVPPASKAKIALNLKARGQVANDDAILQAYIDAQLLDSGTPAPPTLRIR